MNVRNEERQNASHYKYISHYDKYGGKLEKNTNLHKIHADLSKYITY